MSLDPYLQKQVELGMDGADIMHGHLKTLMYETEQRLSEYTNQDDEEYDQTVDRLHLEGYLDGLTEIYSLTYDIGFAKGIIIANKADGHI
jgi:hypothetical protein